MQNLLSKFQNKLAREGATKTLAAVVKYPFGAAKRRQIREMLEHEDIGDRFSEIYEKNLWSSPESGSGHGSELAFTAPLRAWLLKKIPELDVKVFVDAPCGDFNWMQKVVPATGIHYHGLDIVPSVIESNAAKHTSDKIQFSVGNICADDLPACDLLMVRDCLFHLSYADVDKFLRNIEGLDYRFLLTTTHDVPDDFENSDISSGDFRLIDLYRAPFNFDRATVIDAVDDYPENAAVPRQMILIAKKDVPTALSL